MATRWSLELPLPTAVLMLPLSTATFCVDFTTVPVISPDQDSNIRMVIAYLLKHIIIQLFSMCVRIVRGAS